MKKKREPVIEYEYSSIDLDWNQTDVKNHFEDLQSFDENSNYTRVNAYGLINPGIKNLSLSLHNVLCKLEKRLNIPNAKKVESFSERLLNVQIDSETNKMIEVQILIFDKDKKERQLIRTNASYFIENVYPSFSDNVLFLTFKSPTASKKMLADVAFFISLLGGIK